LVKNLKFGWNIRAPYCLLSLSNCTCVRI
jgi:hypothetical protein